MTWDNVEKCTPESVLWQDQHIRMSEHPAARSQAVANHDFQSGEVIFMDNALASALLPDQKGLRCDACFRQSAALKRCSGCVEYWYCGKDCQNHHWKAIHKCMCKTIPKFRATTEFQTSSIHRRVDAFLLSHLVAEHGHKLSGPQLPEEDLNDPLGTFASLLPLSAHAQQDAPLICPGVHTRHISPAVLSALFNRFGNNNFVVHAHLVPIGHGIFALASRLFNHSCVPNAIVTYVFFPKGVRMIVKALTEIREGDAITIPYFDPALPFPRRQELCRYSYGFECDCSSCSLNRTFGDVPSPPTNSAQRLEIEALLLKHVFTDINLTWPRQPLLSNLPSKLRVVLHESFLPELSKTFNDAAHDEHYSIALQNGLLLLALYLVIYPSRFPQIGEYSKFSASGSPVTTPRVGVHCLEVAKTAWNAVVRNECIDNKGEAELLATSRQFLALATDSLSILGNVGDDGEEPLIECMVLDELLKSS